MTLGDGVVVLVCLAAGYWLVSRILTNPDAQQPAAPDKISGPEPATPANWFHILEVSENASREEIIAAYRRMISQYHPDKVAQMGEDIRAVADAKSQQINAAYEIGMQRSG